MPWQWDSLTRSIISFIQILRTLCDFNELNYTLVVENKQGNIIAEVNTFPDPDSGLIKENINLDLKKNCEYSLKVGITIRDQSQTATSQKYIFSKF